MTAIKLKIKKGDTVVVLTGKDKGSKGEILKVFPDENRVLVKGINMVKKHTKPSAAGAGGIQNEERPIHASNVALLDPKTSKATRVGYKVAKDGTKTRIARKSGEAIA
jgi:large subunit ribosomal protein L24